MNYRLLFIISGICLLSIGCAENHSDRSAFAELKKGFEDPPLEARPRALWDWVDGNFELAEITREMEEAKKTGMGGFDIWDVRSVVDEKGIVPAGPAFMSEAYIDGIVHAINEAERIGLDLGLIVASGWNAGGAWTRPEHQTMGIFYSEVHTAGGKLEALPLPFPVLPDLAGKAGRERKAIIPRDETGKPVFYKDIAVLAIRQDAGKTDDVNSWTVDLTEAFSEEDGLNTELPPGDWKIVRYVCTNTGQPMISSTPNSTGPMIDHFSAEATEVHINFFIDKLEAALGKPIGESGLDYLYTDSYEVQGQLWTPLLAEEFQKRTGYSLVPYLTVFSGDDEALDPEIRSRFMYDFRKVLSDLIIGNHYRKATEICEANGIGFVAEAAGPGWPIHNCPFESIKSSGSLSFPRGEFWHLPVKTDYWRRLHGTERGAHYLHDLQVIKGVASASHLYGQKYVEAEAFTGTHLWIEGPGDLKSTADRAFCEGLNRINFHTWPHTPAVAGEPGWVYAFGTLVSETRIWWPKAKEWMDYLARCSYLLQQGNFMGDLLYFYGDSAPNFVPPKQFDPDLGVGYDYDYTNTEKLLEFEVTDGRLTLDNGQTYQLLVLPDRRDMTAGVLEKVMSLVESGATVLGPKPVRSHGLADHEQHDVRVRAMADELWGTEGLDGPGSRKFGKGTIHWMKTEREILLEMGVGPDFDFHGNVENKGMDFIHRRKDDVDIYMVRNTTPGPVFGDGLFRVNGKTPHYWDPVTGNMIPCPVFMEEDGITRVPLTLDRSGSLFIVFGPGTDTGHFTGLTKDGMRVFPFAAVPPDGVSPLWFTMEPSGPMLLSNTGIYSFFSGDDRREMLNQQPTEVTVIEGPWDVCFPEEKYGPGDVVFEQLTDWTQHSDPAIRFFSGIATYSKAFTVNLDGVEEGNRFLLDLGLVTELADVYINGTHVRTLWTPMKYADVTDYLEEGSNELRIDVANTWHNQLIADSKRPDDERITRSNVIRLPNAWSYPMDELPTEAYDLQPAGLMGPVLLVEARSIFSY